MALSSTAQSFRRNALELRAADRSMYLVAQGQIRTIIQPAIEAMRQGALDGLPKRGGLNEWVAAAVIKPSILTGPRSAGVRIRAVVPGAGLSGKGHDLPAINDGRVRHPVFGNPKAWSTTYVRKNTLTAPLDALAPALELRCVAAMNETARIAGFH